MARPLKRLDDNNFLVSNRIHVKVTDFNMQQTWMFKLGK